MCKEITLQDKLNQNMWGVLNIPIGIQVMMKTQTPRLIPFLALAVLLEPTPENELTVQALKIKRIVGFVPAVWRKRPTLLQLMHSPRLNYSQIKYSLYSNIS